MGSSNPIKIGYCLLTDQKITEFHSSILIWGGWKIEVDLLDSTVIL